jgi:hypothetical protein
MGFEFAVLDNRCLSEGRGRHEKTHDGCNMGCAHGYFSINSKRYFCAAGEPITESFSTMRRFIMGSVSFRARAISASALPE